MSTNLKLKQNKKVTVFTEEIRENSGTLSRIKILLDVVAVERRIRPLINIFFFPKERRFQKIDIFYIFLADIFVMGKGLTFTFTR